MNRFSSITSQAEALQRITLAFDTKNGGNFPPFLISESSILNLYLGAELVLTTAVYSSKYTQISNMEHLLDAADRAEPIPTQREMSRDVSNHLTCFRSANLTNQEFGLESTQIFGTVQTREELNESSTEPNPWHRDYVAKFVGHGTSTVRDRVYNVFFNSSLNSLRELGKASRTKHTGVKNTVLCQLMLKGKVAVQTDEIDWEEFLCGQYKSFWSNPSRITTSLRSCPSDVHLRAISSERGERMKRTAAITCHEFARLVGILIEKKEARSALLSSGFNLMRIEQQCRMGRDEF